MPNRTLTIPPVLPNARRDLFFATASQRAVRLFTLLQGFVFTCLVVIALLAAGAVDQPQGGSLAHAADSMDDEADVRIPSLDARLESEADVRLHDNYFQQEHFDVRSR